MGQNTVAPMTKDRIKEILYSHLKDRIQWSQETHPALEGMLIEEMQDDLADIGISMEEARAMVDFIKNDKSK